MKGVILCAGRGTRMEPFSFTLPKTLLPVANQPLLDYCLSKMINSGIKDIAIIIHPNQTLIVQHLRKYEGTVNLEILYQTEPLGIAHALIQARSFLAGQPFMLMLGDNLITESLERLIESFQGNDGVILLTKVSEPERFGIAHILGEKIISIEEKPKQPKSDLAVVGVYIFNEKIFGAIEQITPSGRGELEITDAIQKMIDLGGAVSFSVTENLYYDVGTLDSWLMANQGLLTETMGSEVRVGKHVQIEGCTFKEPVLIGDNCILKNAVIGPYVSIDDNCVLTDCVIEHSICLKEAEVQNFKQTISHSILGQRVKLFGGQDMSAKFKCILGDKSQLFIEFVSDDQE